VRPPTPPGENPAGSEKELDGWDLLRFVLKVVAAITLMVTISIFWVPSAMGAKCSYPDKSAWEIFWNEGRAKMTPGERQCILTTDGWVPR